MDNTTCLVNGREPEYKRLPSHMQEGMKLYLDQGVIPGSFLRLILENDFVHAAGQADYINKHKLFDYAAFLYLECPSAAWGSPAKVKAWSEERMKLNGGTSSNPPGDDQQSASGTSDLG